MNEAPDNVERRTEEYFAAQRGRLRAPGDLWPRVEAAITERPAASPRRWRALAVSAVAAAALALTFAMVVGRLGSGGPQSAEQVLAGALDALMNPESVGLSSYTGVMEIESEITVGSTAAGDAGISIGSEELGHDGTPLPEGTAMVPDSQDETVRTKIRLQLAFKSPGHYRFETEVIEPAIEAGERAIMTTDGGTIWSYDSRSNTYSRAPLEELALMQYRFLHPGAFVGSDVSSLLQAVNADAGTTATLVDEDTLLGRPVYVIEISPAYRGSTTGADGTPVDYSGGVVRLWLDKEFLFTLRMEMPDDGGTFTMRMTEIAFNTEISDNVFRFDPPEGAVEVAPGDEAGVTGFGAGPGGLELPRGFLTPAYVPRGFESTSVGTSSDDSGQVIAVEFTLGEADGEGLIRVQQRRRPDGMPDELKRGREVAVNGQEAWLASDGGKIVLAWQAGDLVVQIEATGVRNEKVLIEMAGSMRPSSGPSVPGGEGPGLPVEEAAPGIPDAP